MIPPSTTATVATAPHLITALRKQPSSADASNGGSNEEWQENRASDGRIYWYHKRLNISSWEKPNVLRSAEEKLIASNCAWMEYKGNAAEDGAASNPSGGTYWYNSETKESRWEVPPEIQKLKENWAALDAEDWSDKKFNSKGEARREFKKWLERKGVGPRGKWEELQSVLMEDDERSKWKYFNILTIGERKHGFNEFISHQQKRLKEKQRLRKISEKDILVELLSDWQEGKGSNPLLQQSSVSNVVCDERMRADVTYSQLSELLSNCRALSNAFDSLSASEKAEILEDTAQQVFTQYASPGSALTKKLQRAFELIDLEIESDLQKVVHYGELFLGNPGVLHPLTIAKIWRENVISRLEKPRRDHRLQEFRKHRLVREAFRQQLKDSDAAAILVLRSDWKQWLVAPAPPSFSSNGSLPELSSEEEELKLQKVRNRVHQWMLEDAAQSLLPPSLKEELPPPFKRAKVSSEEKTKKIRSALDEDIEDGEEIAQPSEEQQQQLEETTKEEKNENEELALAPKNCEDERYIRMFLQGGSTAFELFNDYMDELWNTYDWLRSLIKESSSSTIESLLASTDGEILNFKEKLIEMFPKTADWHLSLAVLNAIKVHLLRRLKK